MPSPAQRAQNGEQNASTNTGSPGSIPSTPDEDLLRSQFFEQLFARAETELLTEARLVDEIKQLIRAAVQTYRRTGCLPGQTRMHGVVKALAQMEEKSEAFQQRLSSLFISPTGRTERPVETFDVLSWANTPSTPQLNRPAPRRAIGGTSHENI